MGTDDTMTTKTSQTTQVNQPRESDARPSTARNLGHAQTARPAQTAGHAGGTTEGRPIITVEGMHVSFSGTDVTHGVDLTLVPGRVTALVGESGSGKSVTAMALPHLDPPAASVRGTALLRDGSGTIDLLAPGAPLQVIRGGKIGTIFQEPMTAFNPLLTIGRQVGEALDYHGPRLSRAQKRERVLDELREVGLADAERIYASHPHELSGGQLQRAMIAMAVINRPEVLIADEPTTALDVTTQKGILALLDRLTRERRLAVLLITHDMGVVWQAADDVFVMHDGRIVEHGPKQEIFAHPAQEYTRTLLAAVPRLDTASLRASLEANEHDWAAKKSRCSVAAQSTSADENGAIAESDAAPVAGSESGSPAASRTAGSLTDGSSTSGSPEDAQTDHAGNAPILRVEDLSVRYGHGRNAHDAVSGINLAIGAGETLALVGESGAGKTTIARAVSGQIRPASGRVLLDGTDLAGMHGRRLRQTRAQIGYVFQDSGSALNPARTVGWSIAEPLQVHGWDAARRRQRVAELLEQVSLPQEMAGRYPSELSGGQRQRIGIARALALRPRLLIADEPTSALDVTVQKRVLDLLHDLRGEYGYACLFITHDLGIVQEVADRVAVIRSGRIVEQGSMVEVLAHPRHDYTRTLLDASPTIGVRPEAV